MKTMLLVAVTFPHDTPLSRLPGRAKPVTCAEPIEIEVGRDQDGPDEQPYLFTEDYGTKCGECGRIWSPEDRKQIESLALEAAKKDDELDDDLDDEDDDEDLDDDLDDDDEDLDDDDDDFDDEDDDDDDLDDEDDEDDEDLDDEDDDGINDELENPRVAEQDRKRRNRICFTSGCENPASYMVDAGDSFWCTPCKLDIEQEEKDTNRAAYRPTIFTPI